MYKAICLTSLVHSSCTIKKKQVPFSISIEMWNSCMSVFLNTHTWEQQELFFIIIIIIIIINEITQ